MMQLLKKYSWYGLLPIAIILMFVFNNSSYSYSVYFSIFSSIFFSIFILIRKNTVVVKVEIFFIMLLCLFFWATVTSFFADQYISSSIVRSFLVFFPLILLYLALNQYKDLAQVFNLFSYLFVIYSLFLSVVAIILFFWGDVGSNGKNSIQFLAFGPFSISQVIMGSSLAPRVSSLTPNPNTFAGINTIGIPLLVYLYRNNTVKFKYFILIFSFLVVGVFLTLSRAGMAAVILSLIVLYTLDRNFLKFFKKSLFIVISISFLYLIVGKIVDYYNNFRNEVGLSDRDLAWKEMIFSIENNLFTGIGFGVSSEKLFGNLEDVGSGHNSYLIITSEIGLIGFLLFLCIWVIFLLKSFNVYFYSEYYKNIASTIIAVNFSWIIIQTFEGQFLRFHAVNYVFFFMGMMMCILNKKSFQKRIYKEVT
ncbi:O-antigen ligase family protein [Acinetobacter sp. 197]|uniref:O-antigen ligase family protein n=1 Tax=Acinetobacter sp. 197 TaxID=3114696 RepID=UPI003A8416E5